MSAMRGKRAGRSVMQVGDRVMINKETSRKIYIVARTDIPHSTERVFVTKSGGDFTIGLKIWKSDFAWNEKNQMWTRKK